MSEAVIVILYIAQNFSAARFQNVRGQFFRGRFAGASGYGDNRLVPFKINPVGEILQRLYRVIDKDQPVFEICECLPMFFKPLRPDNARDGAFIERRWNKWRRIVEI